MNYLHVSSTPKLQIIHSHNSNSLKIGKSTVKKLSEVLFLNYVKIGIRRRFRHLISYAPYILSVQNKEKKSNKHLDELYLLI